MEPLSPAGTPYIQTRSYTTVNHDVKVTRFSIQANIIIDDTIVSQSYRPSEFKAGHSLGAHTTYTSLYSSHNSTPSTAEQARAGGPGCCRPSGQ